jgi:hypothetical protein
MAIKFLHDLDLTGQELKNVKLHVTSSAPTAALGAMYYDSGANVLKYYSNAGWQTISNDTNDDNTEYSTSVVDSSGIRLRLSGTDSSTDDVIFAGAGTVSVSKGTGDTITITGAAASAASATATGVLKLFSNTVQSTGANEVTSTNGRTYGLQVDSSGRGVVNIPWTDTDTNTQRSAGTGLSLSSNTLNVNVGATGTTQAPQSISTTANRLYQVETDDQDNLVVNVPWANTDTNTDTLQTQANSTSSSEQFVNFVGSATGAQTGLTNSAFKFIPSTGTLKVTNLIVSGDTTTANETVKVIENNTLQFEGASGSGADDELNLTTGTLSADRTVTLADLSGHVALFAAAPSGTITATPAELNVLDDFTGVTADLTYAKDLRATGVTTTEFDYLDGVTSSIQTQLNAKQATITGGATTIASSNLTASRALVSNGSGKVAVSAVTSTEIGYLDGVSSNIQTQLNNKQASGTYNTIIGIDTDIDTSGVEVVDQISLTDGVVQTLTKRTLPTADASNAGVVKLASAADARSGSNSEALTPTTLAARSVHATIDVSDTTFTSGNQIAAIQHDLGTEDVIVQLFDSSTKENVYAVVERKNFAGTASTSTVRITFSDAPDNDIEVIITSTKGATVKTPSYS